VYFAKKTSHLLLKNSEEIDSNLSSMLKAASEKSLNKLSLHMRFDETNEAYYHIGQLFCLSVAAYMAILNQNKLLEKSNENEDIDVQPYRALGALPAV
jgi:hypothetical protein